jgi:hypothetical protein
VGCLVVLLAVLLATVLAVFWWLEHPRAPAPVPGQQRCVATASAGSVSVDLDQAHYASIIVGLSVRRGLPPRAASIALATAYQESGIRNLDYGDRDSVGLFQQRPSQGWGSEKQLSDPYYATGKFYDALVKVKNWRTDEINDVAQKVQRSGHPDAYRDHETDGRVLASALSGQTPAGLERSGTDGNAPALLKSLDKTFGDVSARRQGSTVAVRARSERLAYAYASYAVANSRLFGLVSAEVGGRRWETAVYDLPAWEAATPKTGDTVVTLVVR